MYQLKYFKDIFIETDKITIDLDVSNYQSFMHLKPKTVVLRLRIKEIDFKEKEFSIKFSDDKIKEITEPKACDSAALLIFRFLIFTNLSSTLEEIIFLSGLEINLDLLDFLIVNYMKRKINLQFYEYLSKKLPTD